MSGMKRNTIAKVISNKVENWILTITDKAVQQACRRDTIVTGGAVASMLLGESPNDYDIYFRTKETALAVAKYYVEKQNKITESNSGRRFSVNLQTRTNLLGEEEERILIWTGDTKYKAEDAAYAMPAPTEYEEEENIDPAELKYRAFRVRETQSYDVAWISENAITLKGKIQLVMRFYGEPAELHRNYDFAHAMGSYDHWTKEVTIPEEAMEALLSKTLIYKGSLYPIASLFRIRKFIARGWRITAGQMLKIVFQLQKIDMSDPAVLKEQLIGVDQLYMFEFIRLIEQQEPGTRIDDQIVARFLDQLFD